VVAFCGAQAPPPFASTPIRIIAMPVAEWSVLRIATTCLAWLVGIPVLGILILVVRSRIGALFEGSTQGEQRAFELTVMFEYGPFQKLLFFLLWLGPPLMLLLAWLVLRFGFDRPAA
jgi:hypothetical protein